MPTNPQSDFTALYEQGAGIFSSVFFTLVMAEVLQFIHKAIRASVAISNILHDLLPTLFLVFLLTSRKYRMQKYLWCAV